MMRMEIGVKGKKIIGCAAGQQEIKKNLDIQNIMEHGSERR